jgi:hypothetical protein
MIKDLNEYAGNKKEEEKKIAKTSMQIINKFSKNKQTIKFVVPYQEKTPSKK